MESKSIFPNKKYKEAHALSIRGKTHFYRIVSQRLPEGEALDQQALVPGTMIKLGPETRKFLKEASREAFVEAVKLVNVRNIVEQDHRSLKN